MDQAAGSYGGGGGNKDGHGSGGTAGTNTSGTGNSGVGGWGGGGFGWHSGPLIAPSSWSPGMGQSNTVAYTGSGGGGFGGGGLGGNPSGDGGGGGSWAAGNTAHDAYGPTASPSSPGGPSGAVQFAYVPGPEAKNVVARAQVTTPAHPQPTDCLGTADAGTILTNQNYNLVWGSDGYLRLNNNVGTSIWRSGNTTPGSKFCFQYDGNLVIYGSSGAVWASNTADSEHNGNGALWMRLDSSCNLVVVNASQTTLFETNTTCSIARSQLATPSHPQPTDCLGTADAGPILTSRYQELVWEADGHLVFYDATHAFIWKAGNLTPGDNLCFQGDGNLVIYSNGTAVWASGTDDAHHGGKGGVSLAIIEPCQFVILDASGSALIETIQSCPS
jgi:hypothetical protein